MTPEAQRTVIAEACGWKLGRNEPSPPNYLGDLNAMHDAEGALTHEQLLGFDRMLHIEVCKGSFQEAIHATAAQRAEAFLKAIGKWVD